MNCKAGDLVRYVGPNKYERPNIYGWVGTVIKHTSDDFGHQCWQVFPALPGGLRQTEFAISHGFLIDDSHLKPIRDTPGADETLLWAPVPGERVTA